MNYIIIGGSAAGITAAQTIYRHNKTGKIIILSDEPYRPYFKPLLPLIISGKKKLSDITFLDDRLHNAKNISIMLRSKAETIDTVGKTVILHNGEEHSYDKILFATGSRPYIPPYIEGINSDGVFVLKTVSDAEAIKKRLPVTQNVVMIGGGLINLKTAFSFIEKNIKVTFIISSSEILSNLMEPPDTFLIKNTLKNAGIKFLTNSKVEKILSGKKGVKKVILENGKEIECETVCIGKGIVPNTEFLDKSGITTTDKGILTDNYTACSVSDTYAAGDVAIAKDYITGETITSGLWTSAVEMGKCAGFNMSGIKREYKGDTGVLNAVRFGKIPVIAIGSVHKNKDKHETYITSASDSYRKLVFSEDGKRLTGSLFIGDITRAGLYRYIIREKIDTEKIKRQIIENKLHYGAFL